MFFDFLRFLRTISGLKISYLIAFQLHQSIGAAIYFGFSYCEAFMLLTAKKAKKYVKLFVEKV